MGQANDLQAAIFTALAGDTALLALATGGVHDYVEPSVSPSSPYVVIGEAIATDYSGSNLDGLEHFVSIHIWTRARGFLVINQIMDRLDAVLHDQSLALAGSSLVNLRRDTRRLLRDADPELRHGIFEMRVVTQV